MIALYLMILIAGAVASYLGPWWAIAPVCFILCGWKGRRPISAFTVAALGGITVWLAYTLCLNGVAAVDLTGRVAGIFLGATGMLDAVPAIVPMAVIAVVIIGLVCGFSGLAGIKMRRYINPGSGDNRLS